MAKILTLTLNPALDLTVELSRLDAGQVNRSEEMHTHAAGKGVNVAQVLADLGHQVVGLGRQAAGVDIFGGEKSGDAAQPRGVESMCHVERSISARSGRATGASPDANW